MKYQILFSLKNNETVFINVVCCSRDWPFKGYDNSFIFPDFLLSPEVPIGTLWSCCFHCVGHRYNAITYVATQFIYDIHVQ